MGLRRKGLIRSTRPTLIKDEGGRDTQPTSGSDRKLGVNLEKQFTSIVEEYSSFAFNVAVKMLRNPQDAEEAVQDAFFSVYRALPSFKGQSKVSTWLYRIVTNACLMKIRKQRHDAKNIPLVDDDYLNIKDRGNDPEQAAIDRESRNVIESGLSKLAPNLRMAVVLRDIQGLSDREAADVSGITRSAQKALLHRGRVLLRGYLGRQLTQAPDLG